MWWFTGDQHFNHDNIIQHCNRPFKSIAEMNLHLIQQWNDVVTGKDVVVVVGDFAWVDKYTFAESMFISKLRGNKIFLKGNHDHWWKGPKRHVYRTQVGGLKFMCCHYPLRSWVFGYNVHGHCHGTLPPWKNQLDVGVDNAVKLVGQYRPLSYIEVDTMIQTQNKELKPNDYDYHERETGNTERVLS